MSSYVKDLIEGIKNGRISEEKAEIMLKKAPFVDIGFAKVDVHRAYRQGTPEVIYGAGKTAEQIRTIAETMTERGQDRKDDQCGHHDRFLLDCTHLSSRIYHFAGRLASVSGTISREIRPKNGKKDPEKTFSVFSIFFFGVFLVKTSKV